MHLNNRRKILSDGIFIATGSFIKNLRGLVFLPIILSIIDLDEYGALVQILLNPQLLSPLCTMALGMGFLRFTSKYDKLILIRMHYWTVIFTSIFLSFIGAATLYLLSPVISLYILDGQHEDILRLSSILVITNVLWTQNNKYLKARKRFKLFTVYDLIYQLTPYVIFIGVLVYTQRLFDGLFAFIVVEVLIIGHIQLSILRELSYTPPSLAVLKKFFKYTWALPFSEVSGGLLTKIDRYFIGYFLSNSDIGLYNIAYTIASLLTNICVPFTNYYNSYMPKIWDSGDVSGVMSQVRDGLIYYFVIAFAGLSLLVMYSEPLLIFILPKTIDINGMFSWLLLIIGSGTLCFGAYKVTSIIVRCSHKNHYSLVFRFSSVCINCLLNIVFIPMLGIFGAAITTLVSYLFIFLLNNIFFSPSYDHSFYIKMIKLIIISLVFSYLISIPTPSTLLQLIFFILSGIIFYTALIIIFRIVTIDEIKSKILHT